MTEFAIATLLVGFAAFTVVLLKALRRFALLALILVVEMLIAVLTALGWMFGWRYQPPNRSTS